MTEILSFPNRPKLPPQFGSVLEAQIIDEGQPGPILRDFEAILDFTGSEGINIKGGKRGFFPDRVVGELNSRMSRPMAHNLKRNRQASFPYLHGLYLLLRCSGLGVIKGKGATRRLAPDEKLLESWRGLNAVERYFNALEAWLTRGHPQIISEESHSWWDGNLLDCLHFLSRLPGGVLKIGERRQDTWPIRTGPGFHNVALMDLFGLVTAKTRAPAPGEGWALETVRRTPFGEALLFTISPMGVGFELARLMGSGNGEDEDAEAPDTDEASDRYLALPDEDEDEDALGRWQALLRPLFPEWRNNLATREKPSHDGKYLLKVSLGEVWRRIAMAGSMDLDSLCGAILNAYDFDFDHLYAFYYKDKLGVPHEASASEMDDTPDTADVKIREMDLEPGDSFRFLYDFGDNWEFDIKLERIEPVDASLKQPKVIESHGEAPDQYPNWEEDEWEDDEDDDEEDDEDQES